MKCFLVILSVAALGFLAFADETEVPTTPASTTPASTTACQYPEEVRKALAACVRNHASDDLKAKLTQVNEAVHCEDDACTLKKFCESAEGLVASSSQHYTEGEREQFRTLHVQCATEAAAASVGAAGDTHH